MNPTLYRMARPPADFGVTRCSISYLRRQRRCCAGDGLLAGSGYNSATGLGSVDCNRSGHQWTNAAPSGSSVVASIRSGTRCSSNRQIATATAGFSNFISRKAGISTKALTSLEIAGADTCKSSGLLATPKRNDRSGLSTMVEESQWIPMNRCCSLLRASVTSSRRWNGPRCRPVSGIPDAIKNRRHQQLRHRTSLRTR